MGSKQERSAVEDRRRYDCPNCDVTMMSRWDDETETIDGQLRFNGHFACCAQCLDIFVLTAEGWEEAAGYVRDLGR